MKLLKQTTFWIGFGSGAIGGVVGGILATQQGDDPKAEKQEKQVVQAPPQQDRQEAVAPEGETPDLQAEMRPSNNITVVEVSDTMLIDSLIVGVDSSMATDSVSFPGREDILPEGIFVRTDVLLRSIALSINRNAPDTTYLDTLANHLNIRQSDTYDSYRLELWSSPLGYKGYKTSGNKIMVYGLDTIGDFSLAREGDLKILTAGRSRFVIQESSEFSPLQEEK